MKAWTTERGTDLMMETGETIFYKMGNIVTGWMVCLVQVAVFGILLTGVWYLLKKRWIRNSNARFIYTSLRTVILAFCIPVVYIGHSLYNHHYAHSGDIGYTTNKIAAVCSVLWIIWFGGAVRLFLQYRMENQRFRKICITHCPADKEVGKVLRKVCETLHIRRKIRLYMLPASDTPFICGVLRPTIYLPMRPYRQDELELILTHECVHYMQRDPLWKKLTIWIRVVLWFCPLIRELSVQLQTWCEYSCDSKCCTYYEAKEYFCVLFKLADRSAGQSSLMASYLTEPETKLGERVIYMKREKSFRKYAGITVALGTAMFVFFGICGIVSVDAAINTGYGIVYNATMEEEEVQEDTEYERELTPEEEQYIEEVVTGPGTDINMTSLGTVDYKWTIAANKGKRTSAFKAKKGEYISIKVVPNITNKKMQIGIIKPNGRFRYIIANGKKSCGFEVETNGEYRILIMNCSDVTLTISGNYSVD